MTNILYTMLLSNILCAEEHVYTHENIFEELVECQNQVIESQRNCFEIHKYDTYIMISYKNGIGFKEKLDAKILEMIQEYVEVIGNEQFKLTATVNKKRCEGFDQNMVLEFFQNAYTINSNISEDLKTDDAIIKEFDYYFAYNINHFTQINQRLSEIKVNLQIKYIESNSKPKEGINHDKLNTQKSHAREYVDIILIDNCLHNLQDYELFYNEMIKHIEDDVYKTSLIFIALKLDEKQKVKFNESKLLSCLKYDRLNYNQNLEYHAACLENRTPLQNFIQNNNYILGRVFLSQKWGGGVDESTLYFINYKNSYKNSVLSYNSFTSSIFILEKINDLKCKHSDILKLSTINSKYNRIKTLYVSFGKITFKLRKYYKVKFIDNVQKEEGNIRLEFKVHVKYLIKLVCKRRRFTFRIYTDDDEIPNLVSDNGKSDNEKIKQQHDKLSNIVQNIKKFLNMSFMHYNMKYPLRLLIDRNSMYVDYYKALYSRKISILWNYENAVKSVSALIDKINIYFKYDVKIVLFEYKPMLEQLLVKLINNEEVEMFDYVQNLKMLNDFSTDTEFNENLNKKNLCLQICFEVNEYIQYYYIFLPIFEFQIIKYKHLQNKALVLFNEILTNSKETIQNESEVLCKKIILNSKEKIQNESEVPIKKIILNSKEKIKNIKSENIVALLYCMIDEINKINNIPLNVFWLYFADFVDEKFDFMIYTIILVVFRNNSYIWDLVLKDYEYNEYIYSEIEYSYNDKFEIKRSKFYFRINKIPFFEELFCHLRNLINKSFKQVVEKLSLEVKLNDEYNFCHMQSGNNYLASNKMEEIITCL